MCLGTTEDFQSVFRESQYKLRMRETYDRQIVQLEASRGASNVQGLKAVCVLSGLKYYHPANNDTYDIMHDLLEGVAPYEINLLLKRLIFEAKKLTVADLNCMLNYFDYGSMLSTSKPSEILCSELQNSEGLGQHSHQMLVLLYVLPLILTRYVSEKDPHWKLLCY